MDEEGEAPGDMGAMTGRLPRRMVEPSSCAPPRAVVPVRLAAATADAVLACSATSPTAASADAVSSAELFEIRDVLSAAGSAGAAVVEVSIVAVNSFA